jgi:hypothetical protein
VTLGFTSGSWWESATHSIVGRAAEKPVDIDLQPQEPDDRIWSSVQHAAITRSSDPIFPISLGHFRLTIL